MVEESKAYVREYMSEDVVTVSPDAVVGEVMQMITESDGHSGYPVCERRRVQGFIDAVDLLDEDEETPIFTIMSTDLLVAHPEMKITDAARVILRSGIQRLPVVDDAGKLIGIISNTDVIRSQIERATPEKARKLKETLENIHDTEVIQERYTINLNELIPTQTKVYADELEGRTYELERGLAEPLMVIDNGGTLYLADGHHRVMAANELGIEEMEAFVLIVDEEIDLGMAESAIEHELDSLADVEIVDYAKHPLVQKTQRLQLDSIHPTK